jgi:DNA-binding transcriptional ArsR family regulator
MLEPAGDPFEALGDPNRREILRLLSTGDKPVAEIAAAMPISRPAVSRHLRLLKDAGMVAEQAVGTRRIYHLREQGLAAVQHYLEGVWGQAAARFRLLAENTNEDARDNDNTPVDAGASTPDVKGPQR